MATTEEDKFFQVSERVSEGGRNGERGERRGTGRWANGKRNRRGGGTSRWKWKFFPGIPKSDGRINMTKLRLIFIIFSFEIFDRIS